MQVFTVGRTSHYDAAIAVNDCWKMGARCNNAGGWIWLRASKAAAFMYSVYWTREYPGWDPATFSVYEIRLDWLWSEAVSKPSPVDGVRRLLVDSRVIRKWTQPPA